MNEEIKNMEDFRYWVQVRLAVKRTSQKEVAQKMQIAYPRISEAVNGHPSGRKYIAPLIEELGGNVEDFRAII